MAFVAIFYVRNHQNFFSNNWKYLVPQPMPVKHKQLIAVIICTLVWLWLWHNNVSTLSYKQYFSHAPHIQQEYFSLDRQIRPKRWHNKESKANIIVLKNLVIPEECMRNFRHICLDLAGFGRHFSDFWGWRSPRGALWSPVAASCCPTMLSSSVPATWLAGRMEFERFR